MDSKKSQELNHTNEPKNAAPIEAPPSYNEAMMGNIRPTAPSLETTESTNPSANKNAFAPNPYPPQGLPPVYTTTDPRFAQWDDRATRILIDNRLRMNDQFNRAKDQQERDLLWNIILIQLIDQGYNNLVLYNLIEYWQFQWYIYQSILSGLAGNASNNWQFFEPMHSVFGGSGGGSGFTSDTYPSDFHTSGPSIFSSSSTNYSHTLLPTPIIGPTPIIHQTPLAGPPPPSNPVLETSSTLPSASTTSTVQPLPESSTSVISEVQTLPDASTAESVPLLDANLETSSLLPNGSNGIELSAVDSGLAVGAVTPSLTDGISGDILPSSDATSNLLTGLDSTGANVITSQPTESLVPTLLNNDNVITSQPTFSSPPLTSDDATAAPDGCCGGDEGCCGDEGDCCAGSDDCCAACDDCGGGDCGDCDFS